ncbi:hypothetical protein PRIPAC_85386 [Pristionchus pacificus]|uniref:Uncharacterized protein n=1 Tax=Pristionchus pacificus TaxID=54126 RepID=A0A2A6BLW9_PRIPA|nr:hypothetical protein PRIPAC_85386 [Pristionchus pacificus]|eukprot:PDM66932.1 hypothetical protein PRIPAC_48349 [Pristionchus pacificus]
MSSIEKLRTRRKFIASYYAANRQTVWAACRAVIFGCVVISIGLAMAILGYFDKHLSERVQNVPNSTSLLITHDRIVQYHLKSMQYIGPILMGIGTFVLIIACVITLESRDKHAQIITEESAGARARRAESEARRRSTLVDIESTTGESKKTGDKKPNGGRALRLVEEEGEVTTGGESSGETERRIRPLSNTRQVRAEVHRIPRHLLLSGASAPLADLDSLLDDPLSESPSAPPETSNQ